MPVLFHASLSSLYMKMVNFRERGPVSCILLPTHPSSQRVPAQAWKSMTESNSMFTTVMAAVPDTAYFPVTHVIGFGSQKPWHETSFNARTPPSLPEKFYGAPTGVDKPVIFSFRSCVCDGARRTPVGAALRNKGKEGAVLRPPSTSCGPAAPALAPDPGEARGAAGAPRGRRRPGRPARAPASPRPAARRSGPRPRRRPERSWGTRSAPRGAGGGAGRPAGPGRGRGRAAASAYPSTHPTAPSPSPPGAPVRARGRRDSPLTSPPGTTPRREPRPW